jgi:hypothetical protein
MLVFYDLYAIFLGQMPDGFRKSNPFDIHNELYGVTRFSASKALVNLFGGRNRKGGRFFLVKGTAGPKVLPLTLQLYIIVDNFLYIYPFTDAVCGDVTDSHV